MKNKFKKKNRGFWNEILNHKKTLTDKEAEDLKKITKRIRKEKDFRD
ncbi:hypothetical protein J4429_05735 [Candidatus Pacearchaeota archaeon]|nr:hypothetical protein [Candidatus Pacearchaeota archaeon]